MEEDNSRFWYWIINGVVLLVALVFGTWIHNATQVERDRGVRAEMALCTFRLDLKKRIEISEQYLADVRAHRRPPVRGITDADIQRSLNQQKSTYESLNALHCTVKGEE